MEAPQVALDRTRVEAKHGNLLLQIVGYEQVIEDLTRRLAEALAENARFTPDGRPFPHAVDGTG